MKFTWGTGIAIFYILFATTMVAMVLYSKTLDNSLVVEDYYDKDLQYQSHIDKLKNSQALSKDLELIHDSKNRTMKIQFPQDFKAIEGTILFYRSEDKSKDQVVKITVDSDYAMTIPISNFMPGKWTLKIDWTGDGKPFYKEQVVLF
jgi:nitrogen fixation protein FixH